MKLSKKNIGQLFNTNLDEYGFFQLIDLRDNACLFRDEKGGWWIFNERYCRELVPLKTWPKEWIEKGWEEAWDEA